MVGIDWSFDPCALPGVRASEEARLRGEPLPLQVTGGKDESAVINACAIVTSNLVFRSMVLTLCSVVQF